MFNLKEVNGFQFNTACIKNNLVNAALVYGYNAVGKSNLGYAIFDLIGHLTDNEINLQNYLTQNYLNASNGSDTAKFQFEFHFGQDRVLYKYEKTNVRTAEAEELIINGKTVAYIDRRKSISAQIDLAGAETLNRELTNSHLSLLKYIRSNSVLSKNHENQVLQSFFEFVDGMLMFSSAYGNSFTGLESYESLRTIDEEIIENGNVEDFEQFLKRAGVDCTIGIIEETNRKQLAFEIDGKQLLFNKVASSGTKALSLFYVWRQRFKNEKRVSFLFIDEFDSYYHHELAAFIVTELKESGVQFVLTSHNTSIMTNELLRPDCYFLMKKDSIKSLAQSTPKELREAHNIEKMYKAGSFNGE